MFCPSFKVVLSAEGMCSTLFLLPTLFLLSALQKWQMGFSGLFFLIFLSRISPNCTFMQLFQGPRSQPVSDLLSLIVTKQEELKSLDFQLGGFLIRRCLMIPRLIILQLTFIMS